MNFKNFKRLFALILALVFLIGNVKTAVSVKAETAVSDSVTLLDDEAGDTIDFSNVTDERAKYGSYCYKTVPYGTKWRDHWILRGNLPQIFDLSEITAGGTAGALRFWVWVENRDTAIAEWNGSQAQLGQGWDTNAYVWQNWDSQILDNGWNEIILPFASAGKVNSPDPAVISYINIRTANTDYSTTVYVDNVSVTATTARENFEPPEDYVIVNPCEQTGNLRTFGSVGVSYDRVYEGSKSFLSSAAVNESWILCSDGKGAFESVDISPFIENGAIRLMIYVEDINGMGSHYRFALLSSGCSRSFYWANEAGTDTSTADVGYFWSDSVIKAQITQNGWNEIILPFAEATENVYDNGSEIIYPYSEGVELNEIYFRNYTRTADVYIDSIMLINSTEFSVRDVVAHKLSSADEQSGRYVEGEGAAYLENETEKALTFPRVDLENYNGGYLRFMLYMSDTSSLPSVGEIEFYNTDTFICSVSSSEILPQLKSGWNEVVLRLEDITTVNKLVFGATVGVWDKVWIDSVSVVTAFGEDFSKALFADEAAVDNISSSGEFSYTLLNSCETSIGFSGEASADYAAEGTKSIKSSGEYILCSSGNAPLKAFGYAEDKSLSLKLYIDGEVSDLGEDISLFVTGSSFTLSQVEAGEASGFLWSAEDILPQLKYSHGWNTVTLPFLEAEISGNAKELSLTDIYFKATGNQTAIYTDFITLVNRLSLTEEAYPFKTEASEVKIDGFEACGNSENVYSGAYSLELSAGQSYQKTVSADLLCDFLSGGISFALYAPSDESIFEGEISVFGKSWQLSECVSTERIKQGWNRIYLSFESGEGSFDNAKNELIITAGSQLIVDEAVLSSGFGETAFQYSLEPLSGDANADDIFDIKDLVRLKKALAENKAFYLKAADFNSSNSADAEDIKSIRQMLLGLYSKALPQALEFSDGLCAVGENVAITDVITHGAVGDGVSDDTAAFKSALAYAGEKGGTVYVPFGEYVITESLSVPQNVTLLGEIKENGDKPLICVYTKSVAEGNNTAFINLLYGSAVKGLKIWYPEQTLQNGVAVQYPYTICMAGWQSVCIEDIELVNSFNGIDLSASPHNLEVVRNVKGTVLGTGMLWYGNNDTGRFDNIEFSPEVWLESGVENIPDSSVLLDWTRKNTVGIRMLSIDWHYAAGIKITDCAVGVLVEGGFGKFYDTEILRSNKGIVFEKVAYYGTTLTSCVISADHGKEPLAVSVEENAANSLAFAGSVFSSCGASVIEISGSTSVTATDCKIKADKNGNCAINNLSGSFAASFTDFSGGGNTVNASAERVNKFAECTFENIAAPDSALCEISSVSGEEIYVTDTEKESYALKHAANTELLINAADFGVIEESEDVSNALQQAIDFASSFGGGTVYIPTGDYYLQNPVTVHSGVTLLGSYDNPHYSAVKCTTFITDYGRNAEDAQALFTLNGGSAIRGFTVSYNLTRLDGTPYAYTLRGNGREIYISNIAVDGAYRVLDMSTNRCDNHYVAYLLFSAFDTGISVGAGSKNGVIRDCHSNPSQLWDNRFTDRSYWLETVGTQAIISSLNQTLKAYVISDTENQMMFMNFVYAANIGVWAKDNADVTVISQGVDYTLEALMLSGNAKAVLYDAQLSCSAGGSTAVVADSSYNGRVDLYDVTVWACTANAVNVASGKVNICGGVFFQCADHAITASGGDISICGVSVVRHNSTTYDLADEVFSFREFANLYSKELSYSR